MAGSYDAWNGAVGQEMVDTFSISRFLEYTNPSIAEKFVPISVSTLQFVSQLYAVFMSEIRTNREDGTEYLTVRIGRVWDLSVIGTDIHYRYRIDNNLGDISVPDRSVITRAFNMDRFELHRTHWAIKPHDLFEALSASNLPLPAPQLAAPVASVVPPPPPASDEIQLPVDPPVVEGPVFHNVEDFMGHIMNLTREPDTEIFYRGHFDKKKFKLVPSLFRENENGGYLYRPKEETLVRELQTSHASEFTGDSYMLDQLVRMQHYGLPTRLLDVSSNPLVALYFACVDEEGEVIPQGLDGEVIILSSPRPEIMFFDSDKVSCIANLCLMTDEEKNRMDTKSTLEDFRLTPDGQKLLHFIKREKPYFEPRIVPTDLNRIIFVKGRNTHARIQAQSGAFLLFGKDAVLEETGHSTLNVQRVTIRNKKEILEQLDRLNIKTSTIYPGIERAAAEIARKHRVLS